MQNINDVGCLCEMIQSKEKLKAVENHQKDFQNLKRKLGLDPDVVTCDGQDIISALQVAFEGEIILTQYCIENKRIDAYFSKYKLGIEIDEYNHEGKNSNYEKSRQLMIESRGITILRTNPDTVDYDINRLINQIYKDITQSNEEKIKEQENKLKEQKKQSKRARKQNKKKKP